MALLPARSQAVTFTNNTSINEGDTAYDGQDIVSSKATITINGAHSFNSLLLTDGGVLSPSPSTATETCKHDLTTSSH